MAAPSERTAVARIRALGPRLASVIGVVAAFALFGVTLVLKTPTPVGVTVGGLAIGAFLALQAIGLVLVYRANRIINLAQFQIGAVAGTFFFTFVQRRALVLGLRTVCAPCVPGPPDVGNYLKAHAVFARTVVPGITPDILAVKLAPAWMLGVNYGVGVVLALGLAVFLAFVLSRLIGIFATAPRLILTVVTIGAGQFALQVAGLVTQSLLPADPNLTAVGFSDLDLPPRVTVTVFPVVLHTADLAGFVVLAAAVGGLCIFFRRSSVGLSLRAANDNSDRAQTLGVNIGSVTSTTWAIAGLLGGLASILQVMHSGAVAASSTDLLVMGLVALAMGALVSIPMAVIGALALGASQQAVLFKFGDSAIFSVMLVVVLLTVMLIQVRARRRADFDAEGVWSAGRDIRPTPQELKGLPTVRRTYAALAVVLLIGLLGAPWLMSADQIVLGMGAMCAAMVALSLFVLTGWAGQISLGQLAFAAIGAWVASFLDAGMPVGVLVGAIAGSVAATLIGLPALRLRGMHLSIVTLAVSAAVSEVLLNPRYLAARVHPAVARPALLGIDFEDDKAFYYLTFVALVVATVAVLGLRRSRTARVLVACKDNEAAAQAFGINLVRARLTAFAIAGSLAGAAGAIQTYGLRGLEANQFTTDQSIQGFLSVVIGGLGALTGPFLGVGYKLLLTFLQNGVLAQIVGVLASPGIGVILVILLFPGGLAQVVFGLRDSWLRRLAVRYRIEVPSLLGDTSRQALLPIAPLVGDAGGDAFVQRWYRPDGQWVVDYRRKRRLAAAAKVAKA